LSGFVPFCGCDGHLYVKKKMTSVSHFLEKDIHCKQRQNLWP